MTKKLLCVILINIIVFFAIDTQYTTNVYAAKHIDDVISGAQGFLDAKDEGKEDDDKLTGTINEEELKITSNLIYNMLLAISIAIAVIIGMILGIKFMISGVEEQAKIKEALIPYVLGSAVVFSAFGIWRILVNILNTW